MKKTGILLIMISISITFLAFNMEVVIGSTYNIGLLDERQNIIYLSGILFLAGIMLIGFSVVAKEESKNIQAFLLWTFLTPIFLLATLKIFSDIKQAELKEKQTEQDKQTKVKILLENGGITTFKTNGVMWQRCSVGQTWTGIICSGEAKVMTWDDAMKLSSNFAGYDNWRLPTKNELMDLVLCSDDQNNKYGDCANGKSVYFPNTQNVKYDYWSSEPNDSPYLSGGWVWGVNFSNGNSGSYYKGTLNFVRLVR
jgi:hypothetical protein